MIETHPAMAKTPNPVLEWWTTHVVATVEHVSVVEKVHEEAGWSSHYLFMTLMSAGIAVLGLLLSSPAVVIGAMLISPLMGPIIGLGFALSTFDSFEIRRTLSALGLGVVVAVLFCAFVVLLSPLQTVTSEIAARTRPNLFDLLVALFSGLAGTYAMIRGRHGTIVGVAIATAPDGVAGAARHADVHCARGSACPVAEADCLGGPCLAPGARSDCRPFRRRGEAQQHRRGL